MILHCMLRSRWEQRKNKAEWGHRELAASGFIHCSPPEYFWRVAPNWEADMEERVILCLDETKLTAEVRYEDGDDCGRRYPHIYGLVNREAVMEVLPFLRDAQNRYVKNPELEPFEDQ